MASGGMMGSDLWIKKNIRSDVWRMDGKESCGPVEKDN